MNVDDMDTEPYMEEDNKFMVAWVDEDTKERIQVMCDFPLVLLGALTT